jgi:sarcosine oxidase subunit beta
VRGTSVCVVGAGAIGLASALALARRGASAVRVIEARRPASGSSGLSVGIVETQYLDPLDIELRVVSMRIFDRLEHEHGLRIVRNGYLRLAHSQEMLAAFERSVQLQRVLGVRDASVLDREGVEDLVPDMAAGDVAGGLYGRSDGYLDGHMYCGLLAEQAAALGVELNVGCELLGARTAGEAWVLSTARGEFACDYVVDAAGAWADRVAGLLGGSIALQPQRHQAVVVHLPRELPYKMTSVMDYTPGSGEPGLYFRHERQDALIAGLHTEEAVSERADPDNYVRSVDTEFLEAVAVRLAVRLPKLADGSLGDGWAGLYPVSPDGRPLVGPLPGCPGVIVAAGMGGSGIQLSPAVGELVADWILAGEPRTVPDAVRLHPGREAPAR